MLRDCILILDDGSSHPVRCDLRFEIKGGVKLSYGVIDGDQTVLSDAVVSNGPTYIDLGDGNRHRVTISISDGGFNVRGLSDL